MVDVHLPRVARRFRGSLTRLALVLGLAGEIAAQIPVEVQASPDVLSLEVGQVERLFVSAFDATGNIVQHPGFTFAITDTSVAHITPDGTVSGRRTGVARVYARAGRGEAVIAVVVLAGGQAPPPPVSTDPGLRDLPPGATLQVRTTLSLLPGERARLEATAVFPDSSSAGIVEVGWDVEYPAVATIGGDGAVTALVPGRTRIRATAASGHSASTDVIVQDVPFRLSRSRVALPLFDIDTVRALVPAQAGRPIDAGISWQMADSSIARVGPTGIIQGLGLGATELVVRGFDAEFRLPVVVHRPVRRLLLSPSPGPDPLIVPLTGRHPMHVTALSEDSVPVAGVHFDWEIADPSVAAFDPSELVLTGLRPGLTSLTLRVRHFDPIAWAIAVEPAPIAMRRSGLAIAVSQLDTLGVDVLDPHGGGAPSTATTALRWRSSDPRLVSVDDQGVIRGLAQGVAEVEAETPWGERASARVYVIGDLLVAADGGAEGPTIGYLGFAPFSSIEPITVGGHARHPRFDPQRARIAFSSRRDGQSDLAVMDPLGGSVVRLTTLPGDELHPAWTPDGRHLVYASLQAGRSEIRMMTAEGTGSRQVAAARAGETLRHPTVAPDGRHIAFLWARGTHTELVLLERPSGYRRILERGVAGEAGPVFLPNGELVYTVRQDGDGEARSVVVRRNLDTGRRTVIAESFEPVSSLAPSRDGAAVFYLAARTLFRVSLDSAGTVASIVVPPPARILDLGH